MTKRVVTIVVLVALAVVAYFLWQSRGEKNEGLLAEEVAKQLDIAEYGMEGKVLAVDGSKVIIRTGKVMRTEQGNQFVEFDQEIVLAANVALKVGDRAVFYSRGDKEEQEQFVAYRVDILE